MNNFIFEKFSINKLIFGISPCCIYQAKITKTDLPVSLCCDVRKLVNRREFKIGFAFQ